MQLLRLCFFGNIIERNEILKWSVCKINTKCLEFSCKRAQSRTCSGYAERSRKSQRRGTTPQDRLLLESRTERNDSNQVRSAREIRLIRYGLETVGLWQCIKSLSFGVVPSRHLVLILQTLHFRISLRSMIFPKKQRRKNCKQGNYALHRKKRGVCMLLQTPQRTGRRPTLSMQLLLQLISVISGRAAEMLAAVYVIS